MGGAAVQADKRAKYERTTDPRRMLTHKLLDEAIRKDWENIRGLLPARTATSLSYAAGARKAQAWNEGEGKVTIDLPLQDGWYAPDGNPFVLPNGRKSSADDPEALYLVRHQDREFSGPVGRGDDDVYGRRVVGAGDDWSVDSGVALVGRGATAPLVEVPKDELVKIADPKVLRERASHLQAAATELTERLGSSLTKEDYARLVKPTLDEAAFLIELAGKIEAVKQ